VFSRFRGDELCGGEAMMCVGNLDFHMCSKQDSTWKVLALIYVFGKSWWGGCHKAIDRLTP
jgi:hypothetical protein